MLATAFVLCIAGELLGPVALKRALVAAGEIVDAPTSSEPPAAEAAEGARETSIP